MRIKEETLSLSLKAARSRLSDKLHSELPLHQEIAERLVEHFDGLRLSPQLLLNLGAGGSCLSPFLKARFPQVCEIALDVIPLEPPFSITMDPFFLPFQSNTLDAVVSNLGLFWFEPRKEVFSEILRVLKPEGLFLFSTLGAGTFHGENAFPDMHDVGDDLQQVGFLNPVMEMETLTFEYDSPSLLLEDLTQWELTPWLGENISQDEKDFSSQGLPLCFEIIYGHGWKPPLRTSSQFKTIPIKVKS